MTSLTPVWAKWIDSSGDDIAYSVSADSLGNVYVVGKAPGATNSSLQSELLTLIGSKPNSSNNAGFIIKYSSSGVALWAKWIDGAGEEIVYSVTTDGSSVYITGFASTIQTPELVSVMGASPSSGNKAFLIKYNSSGQAIWGKWLAAGSMSQGFAVKTDSLGNVYISGYTDGTFQSTEGTIMGAKPGASNNGAFLIKYDSNGTALWGKWLDSADADEIAYSLATDSSNNVYVSGYSSSQQLQAPLSTLMGQKPGASMGGDGAFLIKFSSDGTASWGKWIDGYRNEYGYAVATDSSDNVYVVGQSGGNVRLELASYIGSKPYPSSSNIGTFFVKYTSSGAISWARWIDGAGSDVGRSVAVDSTGIYIAGQASDNLVQPDLVSLMGSKPDANSGAFLVKYDFSGTAVYGKWLDGLGIDIGYSVAIDSSNNVFIAGSATNILQSEFSTLMGSKPNSTSNSAGFVVKFGTVSSTAPDAPSISSIVAGNQQLTINFTAPASNGGATITNYKYSTDNGSSWSSAGSTSSPLLITSLTNGTTYQVKILAVNSVGDGTASTAVSGTPATTPSAPTIDSITSGNQQLTVNFTAPASNGGATITNYKYSTDDGSNWSSAASTSSPIVITGLTNGTTYHVKILAVNSVGDGEASNMVEAVTYTTPSAPTIDSISAGDAQLSVTFTPPASNGGIIPTNYKYSTNNGATWVVRSPASTSSPLVITGLTNGTTYQVKILAVNSVGDGAESNSLSGTPTVGGGAPPPSNPPPPTINSITSGDQQLTVNFSAPASNGGEIVTNYKYSIDNGATWIDRSPASTSSPLVITGLTNGTTYQVKLLVVNTTGEGTNSTAVSGTPTTNNGGGGNNSFDPVPVEINLNVNVNAQGQIEVFGEGKPSIQEYIIAEKALPVNALYDAVAAKGLIEIWEPSSAQGDIMASLADSNKTVTGGVDLTGAYKVTSKKLVEGLEALLCDTFNCINAAPFSSYAEIEYTTQRDFGRVALAAYAHALFGHVDATAAITNDKAFVEGMLSINAAGDNETAGGAAARLAAYTKTIGDGTVDPMSLDSASSATDANLAVRLVQAIVGKGRNGASLVESSVQAVTDINSDATLANIVRQVVGQDSNRLINVDFNERTKDIRQLLRFYVGDVIYVNITLQVPAVTIGATYSGSMTGSSIASRFAEKNYTIKITLG